MVRLDGLVGTHVRRSAVCQCEPTLVQKEMDSNPMVPNSLVVICMGVYRSEAKLDSEVPMLPVPYRGRGACIALRLILDFICDTDIATMIWIRRAWDWIFALSYLVKLAWAVASGFAGLILSSYWIYPAVRMKSLGTRLELLMQVASYGERTGFEVPCHIVSAKDDLDSYPLAKQDSTRLMKISSTPQRFWLPLLNDSKDLVAEVFGAAVADPQGAALVRVVVAAPSEGVATDVELLVEEVSVEGEDVLEIRGEEEANAGTKKRRKKKKGTLVCSSVDELHDQTDLLATPLGPYLPDDGERKKSTFMM